ncbi:GNAT family N-acetyltransferase [Amnibacterium setariae]|uniref:GNAT family N-acetyltransferase n=1 Tax=Amnibacterium setariae TaxID=2306585 RepID=A0A3A1U215_9MICO|nr:GNAT family N-acetyltransferase [Amnibacterium setariae]RIX30561.1 GNAT family N-acetyltransferase [Amnibacterium setariae]
MTEPAVLREDDSRASALLEQGWRVAHRSWGARLRAVDTALLSGLVAAAEGAGLRVAEAGPDADAGIAALEAAVRDDYPGGPATAPALHDAAALAALRARGTRFFIARDGDEVVAITAIHRDGEHAETDFTAVARSHRRRGLAEAVKAASVLALAAEGAQVFGTGGADENAASLAMNARLGYAVTERWLTLLP